MLCKRAILPLLFCLCFIGSCTKQSASPAPSELIRPSKGDTQTDESKRVTYPYSIIPGGVRSVQELKDAIEKDPLVRRHHAKANLARMQLSVLTSDRKAFVSYRVANKVYWTAKPVRLNKGEQVLTDGETTIRNRCGNQISEEPQLPVQEVGLAPTEAELETAVDLTPSRAMASTDVPTALSNLPLGGQLPSIPGQEQAGPLIASVSPVGGDQGQWWGGIGGAGGSAGMPPMGEPIPSNSAPGTNPPGDVPAPPVKPPDFFFPPTSGPPPGPATPWTAPPPAGVPPPYNPPDNRPPGNPPTGRPPPGGYPPPVTPPMTTPPPPGRPPDSPPPGNPPGGPKPPPNSPPGGPPPESVPETATYILVGLGLLVIAVARNRSNA